MASQDAQQLSLDEEAGFGLPSSDAPSHSSEVPGDFDESSDGAVDFEHIRRLHLLRRGGLTPFEADQYLRMTSRRGELRYSTVEQLQHDLERLGEQRHAARWLDGYPAHLTPVDAMPIDPLSLVGRANRRRNKLLIDGGQLADEEPSDGSAREAESPMRGLAAPATTLQTGWTVVSSLFREQSKAPPSAKPASKWGALGTAIRSGALAANETNAEAIASQLEAAPSVETPPSALVERRRRTANMGEAHLAQSIEMTPNMKKLRARWRSHFHSCPLRPTVDACGGLQTHRLRAEVAPLANKPLVST
jgi:hypothetical protein